MGPPWEKKKGPSRGITLKYTPDIPHYFRKPGRKFPAPRKKASNKVGNLKGGIPVEKKGNQKELKSKIRNSKKQ